MSLTRKITLFMGVTILTVSAVLLAWTVWPFSPIRQELVLSAEQMQISASPDGAGSVSLGDRQIVLEVPSRVWAGDHAPVRLTVMPLSSAFSDRLTPVEIEARLDLGGVEVDPDQPISGSLSADRQTQFEWSIEPAAVGAYHGTAWLHLKWPPAEGNPGGSKAISAQPFKFSSFWVLGQPAFRVRTFALIAGAAGIGLVIFGLLGNIHRIGSHQKAGH